MKILLIISSLFLSSYAYATGIDIPKSFIYIGFSCFLVIPVTVILLITIKSRLNRSKKKALVGSVLASMSLPIILINLPDTGLGFNVFLFFFLPAIVPLLCLSYWLFESFRKSVTNAAMFAHNKKYWWRII